MTGVVELGGLLFKVFFGERVHSFKIKRRFAFVS